MEILFEIFVEAFFELSCEGFISLYSAFYPQKTLTEKTEKIIKCVCLVIAIVLFVGLFAGIIILAENNGQSFWGWLLVSLAVIYLIMGVALKIVSHIKK